MPKFTDYHRTVIGYHGTRLNTAQNIVLGNSTFVPSTNSDDWLGHGVYFWEYAPQRAWSWAQERYPGEDIAVLGSMIRLSNCFDLLDPDNVQALEVHYSQFSTDCAENNIEIPKNYRSKKRTDCAVFEYVYGVNDQSDIKIDTCRAVFVPSMSASKARPWTSSGIFHGAHIQLCVRNVSCIQGVWMMTPEEDPQ